MSSDDSVAANTVNPVNTPRFIVRTNGNIIVNRSTGFGDARVSFNNTNGANDTTIVMRGGPAGNGPVFGIMPWNSEVYLSSGAYYSNFSWVHASPNASSQILAMRPGTGVLWFASNNNSTSWNVAGGSVLWNEQGVWRAPIDTTSKARIIRTGGDMGTADDSHLELHNNGSGAAFISFHRVGVYGAHFGLDTDNWFSTRGWSPGPNGYASMRVGSLNAKGRITPEDWIEFTEHEGLSSPINAALLLPNDGSYGSWRISGSRNGWYGLEFDTAAGRTSLMMGHTSQTLGNQHVGAHNNTWGWLWYFAHRTLYSSAQVDLDNTAYYVDPNNTSVLRVLRVANGSGTPIQLISGGVNNGAPFEIQAIGDGGGGTNAYFDIQNWGVAFRWRFGSPSGMVERMTLSSAGSLWIQGTLTQS